MAVRELIVFKHSTELGIAQPISSLMRLKSIKLKMLYIRESIRIMSWISIKA